MQAQGQCVLVAAANQCDQHGQKANNQCGCGHAAVLHGAGEQHVISGVPRKGEPAECPPCVQAHRMAEHPPAGCCHGGGKQAVQHVATGGHFQRRKVLDQFGGQKNQPPQSTRSSTTGNAFAKVMVCGWLVHGSVALAGRGAPGPVEWWNARARVCLLAASAAAMQFVCKVGALCVWCTGGKRCCKALFKNIFYQTFPKRL